MTKTNKISNKTKRIFLICLPFILILSLIFMYNKYQNQQEPGEFLMEMEEDLEEEIIEQYTQEPVKSIPEGLSKIPCKVRFDTPTRNLCRNNAGSLVIKGTVVEAPKGAKLQTSWFQVDPVRTAPQTASFQVRRLPYSFSVSAQWPGKSGNEAVKVRALANIYDADGNKLPHCSASNATYWYPYLECGAVLESPGK